MKKIRPYLLLLLIGVVAPLCVTGYLWQSQDRQGIVLDEAEQRLLLVMAAEISPDSEPEVLKMQAVIDRTRIAKAAESGTAAPEALSGQELVKLWGKENYNTYLEKFQEAIVATQNQTITYEGALIYPEFHYMSNGHTRSMSDAYDRDDFPYLQGTESLLDLQGERYMTVVLTDKEKFQKICAEQWDITGDDIDRIVTDGAGYVVSVTVNGREISGEDFARSFGLASPSFSIRDVGKQYRMVVKGIGHGFGVSQYGANEMARMGATYDTILKYYYQGITLTNE